MTETPENFLEYKIRRNREQFQAIAEEVREGPLRGAFLGIDERLTGALDSIQHFAMTGEQLDPSQENYETRLAICAENILTNADIIYRILEETHTQLKTFEVMASLTKIVQAYKEIRV